MKNDLQNRLWGLGVRVLHICKRLGVLGSFEPAAMALARRVLPPPATDVDVILPTGARMVVPAGFARARSYAAGLYEPQLTALILRSVREGMTFVDVGAFCGYYTLLASQLVGNSGRVFAFEPNPVNFAYLVRNVRTNGCTNVIVCNQAVAEGTGERTLLLHTEADHHWLVAGPAEDRAIRVQALSLDDFFSNSGWPDVNFVKLDIEGGECAALHGMYELSERNSHLRLVLELDVANLRRAGASPGQLGSILRSLGFTKGYVIEQGLRPFSVADAFPSGRATYNLLLTKE